MPCCRNSIGHIAVVADGAGMKCTALFCAGRCNLLGNIVMVRGSRESIVVNTVTADYASFTAVALFAAACLLHFENEVMAACICFTCFGFAALTNTALNTVFGTCRSFYVYPFAEGVTCGLGILVKEGASAASAVVYRIAPFGAGRCDDVIYI